MSRGLGRPQKDEIDNRRGSCSLSKTDWEGSRSLSKMSNGRHETYIIAYFCLLLVVGDSDDVVHSFCHFCGTLFLCVEKLERMERWRTVMDYGRNGYFRAGLSRMVFSHQSIQMWMPCSTTKTKLCCVILGNP